SFLAFISASSTSTTRERVVGWLGGSRRNSGGARRPWRRRPPERLSPEAGVSLGGSRLLTSSSCSPEGELGRGGGLGDDVEPRSPRSRRGRFQLRAAELDPEDVAPLADGLGLALLLTARRRGTRDRSSSPASRRPRTGAAAGTDGTWDPRGR